MKAIMMLDKVVPMGKAFIFVVWSIFACAAHAQEEFPPASATQAEINAEEWVVVLEDPRPQRLQGFQVSGYSSKHYKSSRVFKRTATKLAKEYGFKIQQEWFIESIGAYCLIVRFDTDVEAKISALKSNTLVRWIQASNEFKTLETIDKQTGNISRETTLSIPKSLTGRGVKIGLIDSGISSSHPLLRNAISDNHNVVVGGSTMHKQGERHGTAIASIIAASEEQTFGFSGLAPSAELVAYRGCWESASGDTLCNTLSLARALDGLTRSDISILNLSLSGPKDRLLNTLVSRLVENNVIVVTAYDPARANSDRFPEPQPGVLIVKAMEEQKPSKDQFTAPGQRLVASTSNSITSMQGHSVATAYTTGILALISEATSRTENPDLFSLLTQTDYHSISDYRHLIKLSHQFAEHENKISTNGI